MSDIYSERNNLLNSLNFGSIHMPNIPADNESDLSIWTNAQFTYDVKPVYTQTQHSSNDIYSENMPYNEGLTNYMSPYPPIYPKSQVKSQPPLFPKLSLNELASALSSPIPAEITSDKPQLVSQEKPSADDDKRRRNTAASARFRIKKKLKEQDKEKTVREMTEKSESLQKRVNELEQEIKWLRKLLIEKESNN
ncbi:hypothetical protein BY458DRAFT_519066 [Sporodiniella umbellata]|nr:hypothetical protein BY458DRAFT_519066 [Sporodiniella umbellata]